MVIFPLWKQSHQPRWCSLSSWNPLKTRPELIPSRSFHLPTATKPICLHRLTRKLHSWSPYLIPVFCKRLQDHTYPCHLSILLLVTSLTGCLPVLCTFCNLGVFSDIASAIQGTVLSQHSTTPSLELSQLWKAEDAQTPGVQWCHVYIHSTHPFLPLTISRLFMPTQCKPHIV